MAIIFLFLFHPGLRSEGLMSWYGEPFHGRLTACGEVFDMNEISVAHRTLPMGSEVIFFYNGRFERAIVNDRGPYSDPILDSEGTVIGYTREWDASKRLAKRLFREDIIHGVLSVRAFVSGRRMVRESMRYNLN